MTTPILELERVKKSFGGIIAVNECSFKVYKSSIFGIIGPNGSGKTTLLNLINRILKQDSGDIFFKGRNINGLSPHSVAKLGIGRTFQVPSIFKRMTVIENLLTATVYDKEYRRSIEKANYLLRLFNIDHLKDFLASELSGGQQRILDFIKALMIDPILLLLDEPTASIHPDLREKILDYLIQLKAKGTSVIIVSHDIKSIMKVCDRIVVMSSGSIICEGTPDDVVSDQRVIEAYLGGI